MDGLSVPRTVKENRRTGWIPVIVHTLSKVGRKMAANNDLGGNTYIPKPVGFEQFRETVHTLALYWLLLNQSPPRQALPYRTEKSA